MAYFEGSALHLVGYCGSFKSVISDTVLKNIAPELLESSDTVYAQSDLNIEEIMKLNPDVILYNTGNCSHAEILKASGIPPSVSLPWAHLRKLIPLNVTSG